jgi:hypothetical protein
MLSLQGIGDRNTQWLGELLRRFRHCFFEAYNKNIESVCNLEPLCKMYLRILTKPLIHSYMHLCSYILYMHAFIHATYIRMHVSVSAYVCLCTYLASPG